MRELNSVHKWLAVLLVAVLATSATAGLVVTSPVIGYDGLVIAGNYYDSITVNAETSNVYGMAALLDEESSADIIIMSQLVTDISVTSDGNDGAFCMFAESGTIYTNDINGQLEASAVDGAYGARASTVVTGIINGTISVEASNGLSAGLWGDDGVYLAGIAEGGIIFADSAGGGAYGIYSDGPVGISGAMDGVISVLSNTAGSAGIIGSEVSIGSIGGSILVAISGEGEDFAYGIFADSGPIDIGDISGTITVTVGRDEAYGLFSPTGDVTLGDISGDISATATGDSAYAIASGLGNITMGDIHGSITADAGGSTAYAISTLGDIAIGDVNGTVSGTAATQAAGIRSAGGTVVIDGITEEGSITATVTGDDAFAVIADGDIEIGDIDGTITADAGGDNAYGIWSDDGEHVMVGDINGTITVTSSSGIAAGIAAENGSLETGDISGDITVTSEGGESFAWGLYAYDSFIETGDIHGSITAYSGSSYAYGLYSESDEGGGHVVVGDVNGVISAEAAEGNDAYGIYGDGEVYIASVTTDGAITATAEGNAYGVYGGSLVVISEMEPIVSEEVEIAAFDGTITAETTDGSSAYGIYSGGDVYIDDIGENGSITATSAGDDAYGIYADSSVYIGDIEGIISGTANGTAEETNGDYAAGIYAVGDIELGDVSGSVSGTAAGSNVYGLYSGDAEIYAGHITGSISAETTEGSEAYGIYSYGDVEFYSLGEEGSITAEAGGDYAYGIYSYDDDVWIGEGDEGWIPGEVAGTISATAGNDHAYGIYASDETEMGNVSGNITASAGEDYAAGIYANSDIYLDGIDGEISGEAAYCAAGIYTYAGDVDTGTINGLVTATVNDEFAYGIAAGGDLTTTIGSGGIVDANAGTHDAYALTAYGPMNILVDGGYVSARAGEGDAYAISSGFSDAFAEEDRFQDVNDQVEIVSGSTIVGDIDLGSDGGDSDVLTLSGDSDYTGYITGDIMNVEDVNVTGGTWFVNGDAIDNINGILVTGGILNWLGTVETLNVQGGVFSPGNSIGTTVVTGDFTLAEDSTFVAEVDDDENADLVDVSGEVTLGGGEIAPTADIENPHFITHDFTAVVIAAQNGITGEFDTETFTPYFDYEVVYDTEDPCDSTVALDITPADFTEYAVTKNQNAIGEALNDVRDQGEDMDEDTQDILVAIRNIQYESWDDGGDGEPCLLDELAPQDGMGLAQVSAATMFSFNDSMFDRVNNVLIGKPYAMTSLGQNLYAAAGPMVAPAAEEEWKPFIKAIGSWGDLDGETGVAGYSYDVYGITAGADKIINENWLFGISFGGSMADVDYDKAGTSADIDTAMVALYGSYFKDNWHIDFSLGYGHNWYDSERTIVIGEDTWKAESDHTGNMYSAAVQAGMNLGDNTTIIEPIIGGGFTSIREKGYTEKGADPLNLKVDSHTTDAFYSKVGMRFATEMKSQDNTVLVPEVGAFWIHDFSDAAELDSEFGDGSAFTVEGVEPDDSFNVTAGLNAYFSDWRLFLNYGWLTSSDADSHTVKAGVQWNF